MEGWKTEKAPETHPSSLPFFQSSRLDLVLCFVLFGASCAYLSLYTEALPRVGDEGIVLEGARRILRGERLYRDFFEYYTPGSFYSMALLMKIFGTTLQTARITLVVYGGIFAVATYLLGRSQMPVAWSCVAPLIFVGALMPDWFATSHHWDSSLFSLLSLLAFLHFIKTQRRWSLTAAGVGSGIVFLQTQNRGILLFFAFVLARASLSWLRPGSRGSTVKEVAVLATSFLTPTGLVLLAFPDLKSELYRTLLWPVENYLFLNRVPWGFYPLGLSEIQARVYLPWPLMWLYSTSLVLCFLLLTAGVPIAVGFAAWKSCRTRNPVLWTLALFALAMLGSLIHRPDLLRMVFVSPALLVLLVVHLQRTHPIGLRRLTLALVAGAFLIVGAAQATYTASFSYRTHTRAGTVRTLEPAGVLNFLQRQTRPGEYLFVYGYYPLYYFLTGTRNPTRHSILLPLFNSPQQLQAALEDLKKKRPRFIVYDELIHSENFRKYLPALSGHEPEFGQNPITDWVITNYEPVAAYGREKILRKKT